MEEIISETFATITRFNIFVISLPVDSKKSSDLHIKLKIGKTKFVSNMLDKRYLICLLGCLTMGPIMIVGSKMTGF